jgi:hypothetical protein
MHQASGPIRDVVGISWGHRGVLPRLARVYIPFPATCVAQWDILPFLPAVGQWKMRITFRPTP